MSTPNRSADQKSAAQAIHDHAITLGAFCSSEKAAVARGLTKLAKSAPTSTVHSSPDMTHDQVSSAARIRSGASNAVAASHLPTEGTSTSMDVVADRALAQQLHDLSVGLGADCADAQKIAPSNALAKMTAIRTAGGRAWPPRR